MCRFDEKMAFCDALDHRHAFHSTPIVKYTENGPLPHSSVVDINMFGKESDTMRMFRSEDQKRPDLGSQDSTPTSRAGDAV